MVKSSRKKSIDKYVFKVKKILSPRREASLLAGSVCQELDDLLGDDFFMEGTGLYIKRDGVLVILKHEDVDSHAPHVLFNGCNGGTVEEGVEMCLKRLCELLE